ncbi:hypothetical protein Tco_0929428 [Tanacetum coccineum]
MRNRINLNTIRDDSLLGTLKYVSKTEEHKVYGAVIPKEMINKDILNSTAYKTYYAYASGAKEPKKARKFKKHASLKLKTVPVSPKESTKKPAKKTVPAKKSYKSPARVIMKDTLSVSVSKKKAPVKGDGTDFESGVPDEQQRKTSGTDEETGTKLGVLDVPKYQSESDDESWGDSEDDDNDDDSNDVIKFDDNDADIDDDGNDAHDSEKNYESDDDKENMDQEEYDDLYKDVDVKSLRAEHEMEGKGDAEMTDTTYESASQETSYEQVIEDAHMTLTFSQKTEGSKQSSSVSFEFASKFLNLDNVPPVVDEVASLMNVKTHHEESSTQAP